MLKLNSRLYIIHFKVGKDARQWGRTPLIPALEGQRQVDLCEFEASLVFIVSSRTTRGVTQGNPTSKKKKVGKIVYLVVV